jgi:hypothetical protein
MANFPSICSESIQFLANEPEKLSCVHEDFFFYRRRGAERGLDAQISFDRLSWRGKRKLTLNALNFFKKGMAEDYSLGSPFAMQVEIENCRL